MKTTQNKVIGIFMNVYSNELGYNYNKIGNKGVNYGTSWDWLIPVVQKCFDCDPIESNELSEITHGLLDCNIDEVYNAVIVYIQAYKL